MYRNFKTKTELKKYTRKVVDDIGVCHSLTKEHPHWDLFMYLFSRHSEYPEKCNGLVDVKIQYNPTFKNQLEVIIIKENGEEDDISVFDNCIRGKPKDNLSIAMRNAILSQTLEFRRNSELVCNIEKCKSTKKLVVDHYEPQFIELLSTFKKDVWKGPLPCSFNENRSHSKVFKETDSAFEEEWYNYHKQHATLRILCEKCNSEREKKRGF
jgi:hypothetical protein